MTVAVVCSTKEDFNKSSRELNTTVKFFILSDSWKFDVKFSFLTSGTILVIRVLLTPTSS